MSLWQNLNAPTDGEAKAGFSRVSLDLPHGKALAGYSLLGSGYGEWTAHPMYARAMYLRGADGEDVAIVVLDLMSASRYLHDAVAHAAATRLGIGRSRLIVCGTHTHTGPGGFYGNSLYDVFASHDPLVGFDQALADHIVAKAVTAVEQAIARAQPATVRVDIERVWGVSRNRSVEAFVRNEDYLLWNSMRDMPGYGAPPKLTPEQMRVDPRVVVLSAFDTKGQRLGVFATFACHNTAVGPHPTNGTPSFYDPDWTGAAARLAEKRPEGAPFVLVALSGAGDQSSLPVEGATNNGPPQQGHARAEWVGSQIAEAIFRTSHKGTSGSRAPSIRVAHKDWWTANHASGDPNWNSLGDLKLADWIFGTPTLGGAEDGRSGFWPHLSHEGMTSDHFGAGHPQHPKLPALGLLQTVLASAGNLAPSPVHALHALRVNDHVFATVPGEPTVWAAHQIEQEILSTVDVQRPCTASVIGYAGDYAGYFTTRPEFRAQHYEGASMLYGIASTDHLTERLRLLVKAPPGATRALAAEPIFAVPHDATRALAAAAEIPEPTAHAEEERLVVSWCFARGSAPRSFDLRAFELVGDERVELAGDCVQTEPRHLQLGATPISAWVASVSVVGSTRGRRFVITAQGRELDVVSAQPEDGGSTRAMVFPQTDALRGPELRGPSRMRAVIATWNSYGVPQAENVAVFFAPGSRFPLRYSSTDLAMAIDSPDVLCAQELIGSDARTLFDGLRSYAHRFRRGGAAVEDHGLGIASRLGIEAAAELRFTTKAIGADALIRKGAMHLRVRLTRGAALDVVTTHLQAGGGVDAALVRASQLDELIAFIGKVSAPSRPLLVCGDFNIDGARTEHPEYVHLAKRLGQLSLVDLDATKRRATSDPVRNDVLRQLEPGCASERFDYMFWRSPDGSDLAVESVKLFLDQPLADLRASWQDLTGFSGEAFASDHFGLRVEISYTPE